MEKSLGYGFEYYMDLIPGMKQADPKASSSIVLAYIGDCVFDLIIKMRVVGRGGRQVHKLHEETSRYVQASAQSFMMRAIQEHLTEEEHAVYRRGRNTRSVSAAKNQSITDYRRATGFEALVGYLYLKKEYKRLVELVTQYWKRFALEGRSISCLCWTDVRMVRYARLSGKQKSMEQS